jgi:hypothetical protein
MSTIEKVELSAQATVHSAGQTFPKHTLYNAICDLECGSGRVSELIVDQHGHCYSEAELAEIRRSPEFEKHRADLRAQGLDRD